LDFFILISDFEGIGEITQIHYPEYPFRGIF